MQCVHKRVSASDTRALQRFVVHEHFEKGAVSEGAFPSLIQVVFGVLTFRIRFVLVDVPKPRSPP